jgi:hypothetical protein
VTDRRRTLALYLSAGIAYIALGVFVPTMLLSWPLGAGFLLLVVWILPALVHRLR